MVILCNVKTVRRRVSRSGLFLAIFSLRVSRAFGHSSAVVCHIEVVTPTLSSRLLARLASDARCRILTKLLIVP